MGQGGSKTVVHVQLDAGYYYAGDTVTGAVVLHTEQALDVKAISCKVTGVEKTKWVETRHSSTPSHAVTYHGKHVIFKHKLPLTKAGTIQPGDYQWPISFQLPANVPGTFHYDAADNRAKASIEYKLKAVVDQEGFFKSDIKKTIRFDVLQRNKAQASSGPLNLQQQVPISAWCCINKGYMGLTVQAATDSYLPGDSIVINAQVDNKSSAPVEGIEFKLHQRIHLMGESFIGTINKHIDVVRAVTRQQPVNNTGGAAGLVSHYAGQLDLNRAIEATCLGKVIRSTYELEVVARSGCCLSNARVTHPIVINDPQPHTAPPVMQPPMGWAPQVYAPVTFSVPAPEGCAPLLTNPTTPAYNQAWATQAYAQPADPAQQVWQQQQQQQCQDPQLYQQQQYQDPQYYQQQQQSGVAQGVPACAQSYADANAASPPVPGAVCYVSPQQQQQQHQYYNKAGDAGQWGQAPTVVASTAPGWFGPNQPS